MVFEVYFAKLFLAYQKEGVGVGGERTVLYFTKFLYEDMATILVYWIC